MTNPMELPTRTDLSKLVRYSGGLAISLYMPTHRAGVETLQGPIRLKNLLREAMESLQAAGRRGSEIEELLQPVRRLLEDYDFWQHQSDGLAIFRSADLLQLYRVPLQVPELAVVAEGFHLKPLLACITGNRHFYVLALSQNHARIFRATPEGITELEMKGMPSNLAEVLRDRYAGSQFAGPFGVLGSRGPARCCLSRAGWWR